MPGRVKTLNILFIIIFYVENLIAVIVSLFPMYINNKVFRSFLVILVHVKKRLMYNETLTTLLEGEMRSKKINGHQIVRQNLMENPKKITVSHLEDFYFEPNSN
jgi:hypothetical protein